MNATNLYVTTNQIILKSQPSNASSWQDLYRLLPYLRNSLCCVVCGNLLISPLSPNSGKCQHHLCRKCTGGRKQIKPACVWCKDCELYTDNKQLRTLLQCYKKMCVYLSTSQIYKRLLEAAKSAASSGIERGAANLIALIKEGSLFQDEYASSAGLSKEIYSILPFAYTNSATQTTASNTKPACDKSKSALAKNTNGAPTYSVMIAGSGNKITIKRKTIERTIKKEPSEKAAVFKKPAKCASMKPRRGCRCGNATATPGKLTCCGQRCPCYVESKACMDCKCRGCRNPHKTDGNKVLNVSPTVQSLQQYPDTQTDSVGNLMKPHLPGKLQTEEFFGDVHQMQLPQVKEVAIVPPASHLSASQREETSDLSLLQHVKIELDANLTLEQLNEHLNVKVYDPFTDISQTLPHPYLMAKHEEEEEEDITVDV